MMIPPAPTTAPQPAGLQSQGSVPQASQPSTHLPPRPPSPGAKVWEYLKQRKAELPPDIQQEVAKREGAKANKDLFSAANQMTSAKEDYEKALLSRSQHLQAWKSFLEKAVTEWQEFAKQFMQHEKDLQERINITKELFMKAKVDLDHARQEAGVVVDLTVEEEDIPGSAAGSSVEKVTLSIQHLATSLQQLHAEAAALECEEPHAAKRPRLAPEMEEKAQDAVMNDGSLASPFGRAGQQ